ncbi:cathepsin O [Phyllostomus discolor]|uniref:Cathepsin O n=1 Tax=Phyllostomus discolor TaxID=89673 RepID=A0A6J2M9I8_9CHIR|nr:cathepsin O isoform X1 [Phyllostomus discolor]KAF6093187.1 cathepsin O [Phyllostomus discolor]
MELRVLRRLWLLCCWWCCGAGPGAGPGATFTRTGPRSRERQEAAFRESLNRHQYLNSLFPSENSSAVYGINQFSYLFPEEFKAIYLRSKPFAFPKYEAEVPEPIPMDGNISLPLRFDWRDKHVVTLVRNQQACGGCWAFSVVGAVESAYAIKGKPLEDLSVQQVIDCSYSNYGCNGGSTLSALNWLNKTQVKLVRDSEYPFKAQNGLCHYFSDSHSGFSIKGYSVHDFSDQEDKMAKALLTFGPLVGIVDAVSWQDYLGGIIQHHCSSGEANHAVIITGFDKTGSTPYWIVRNSWGSSWGVDGYAHVKMGGNICGIADSVSAVFV